MKKRVGRFFPKKEERTKKKGAETGRKAMKKSRSLGFLGGFAINANMCKK
jgi:hypothetical protein